jgi:hypothetical protein
MIEMSDTGEVMYFPTEADLTMIYGLDLCRECGFELRDNESCICTQCDLEQWIVQVENARSL